MHSQDLDTSFLYDTTRGELFVVQVTQKLQLVPSRQYEITDEQDLCKLAGLYPAAIICEIVRDEDGLMARRDDCAAFAKQHGLKIITIAALIKYLKRIDHSNGEL